MPRMYLLYPPKGPLTPPCRYSPGVSLHFALFSIMTVLVGIEFVVARTVVTEDSYIEFPLLDMLHSLVEMVEVADIPVDRADSLVVE